MKNPADDVSFKELELMSQRVYYLWRGIQSRREKIDELHKKIMSESIMLTAQGYDVAKMNISIVVGMEE